MRFGLGGLGRAEQLAPLDERSYGERQEGDAADADRDVHQREPAGDDARHQEPNRDGYEKRAEPDHRRSLTDPWILLRTTGARGRMLSQLSGTQPNEARP